MTKRQDNERALQSKIDQLQREIDQMRYTKTPIVHPPVPLTTANYSTRAPTPAERYVNPRSRVKISKRL